MGKWSGQIEVSGKIQVRVKETDSSARLGREDTLDEICTNRACTHRLVEITLPIALTFDLDRLGKTGSFLEQPYPFQPAPCACEDWLKEE
jgi:hypothetical protein